MRIPPIRGRRFYLEDRKPSRRITFYERLAALSEGVALICRSRMVERLGRVYIIRDSRTRREIRLRDIGQVVRALRR